MRHSRTVAAVAAVTGLFLAAAGAASAQVTPGPVTPPSPQDPEEAV
ncbi:hypothetical protein [Streptomyces sp. NPDC058086]